MIRDLINLKGAGTGAEITNTRFTKYMDNVIDSDYDLESLENSQCFLLDVIDTGSEWRILYAGANTDDYEYPPDGRTYNNVDQVFMATLTKSNNVRTGWAKVLDVNDKPKPLFQPSFNSNTYDSAQVWIRSIIVEAGVVHAWFIGDSGNLTNNGNTSFTPFFSYRVGYATSNDYGLTWTKSGTTPIYTDAGTDSRGIVLLKVVNNGSEYVMIYAHIDPNVTGFQIATSTDKTSWTKTHTNILSGQNYGWICDFVYSGGYYYLWVQKNFQTGENFGPARDIFLLRSSDLTNWTSLGAQLTIRPANEFGIGNMTKTLQKPNGEWFMLHTSYKNRIQALAGLTWEPSTCIKVAESTEQIVNSSCVYEYPDFVVFHAPLGNEMGFSEVISGGVGSINSAPAYADLQFIRLSGSQTITFSNSGLITGANLGIKFRVEIKTTGTFELFRIGDDVLVTLESGKLRVRLSSDGAGYEKDYITTVNISKPTGLDYIDNHIYVGFTWIGGVLTLYNDFVPFDDATEITKTVDDSLTTVNNSGSNILIGQNAAIELRSVSVLSGITEQEFIELDI